MVLQDQQVLLDVEVYKENLGKWENKEHQGNPE